MVRTRTRAAALVAIAILLLLGTTACWPPGVLTDRQLATLRQCESTDNYQAVSANGLYRGAYQFDRGTWRSVGGSGDPAAAPPHEQDTRARILHLQRGLRPWPVCGRRL